MDMTFSSRGQGIPAVEMLCAGVCKGFAGFIGFNYCMSGFHKGFIRTYRVLLGFGEGFMGLQA